MITSTFLIIINLNILIKFVKSVCIDEKQNYINCLTDLYKSFEDKLHLKDYQQCCLISGRFYCANSYLSNQCHNNFSFLSKNKLIYEFHLLNYRSEINDTIQQNCPRFLCYPYEFEYIVIIVSIFFLLITILSILYFRNKNRNC